MLVRISQLTILVRCFVQILQITHRTEKYRPLIPVVFESFVIVKMFLLFTFWQPTIDRLGNDVAYHLKALTGQETQEIFSGKSFKIERN